MDSENYLKIKTNSFNSIETGSDVLETPQIINFRHENENNNIFSNSFKRENSKHEDLARIIHNNNNNAESPLSNDFPTSIIEPSELHPVINFNSSSTSSDSSKSAAPKKKFLERTISQTDAEQKELNISRLLQDLNNNYLTRQDYQNKIEEKQRSITFKTMDFYEDINKYAKNVLQPLPHTMPVIEKKQSNTKPQNDNKKSTIENLLNNYSSSSSSNNKISSIIMQKEHLKSLNSIEKEQVDLQAQQPDAKKLKLNDDDFNTSSLTESEKQKSKSKRSIMMNSDIRKQQIRNSNREAARRCRERRSNYIKQLENKITVLETKQKSLMSDNGNLLKQVHDLKKIIMDNSSNVYQTHNFNQLSNNFGAILNNQQLKSVPVVLTLEIPNGNSSLNNNNNNNNNNNGLNRQLSSVLNGGNSLINNADMLKMLIDQSYSQSHQQSTKINK